MAVTTKRVVATVKASSGAERLPESVLAARRSAKPRPVARTESRKKPRRAKPDRPRGENGAVSHRHLPMPCPLDPTTAPACPDHPSDSKARVGVCFGVGAKRVGSQGRSTVFDRGFPGRVAL